MLTNEERAARLGNELTAAVAAYIANPTDDTLSDFCAALIGRCSSMAAAAVVNLYDRVEIIEGMHDSVAAVIAEMIDLHERVKQLEAARDDE